MITQTAAIQQSPEKPESRACLSVVMPVYNEEATLTDVVSRVLAVPYLLEIILVDDCSTDMTRELARQLAEMYPQVRTVRHPRNAGKTAALKTGFALTSGDVVIIQDADLEYDPGEIYDVIRPILDGHADVVYGSRFLVRRAARVLYFYHYLANKFLTFLSNMLTNLNMTKIAKLKTAIYEVPISYYGRTYSEGKKIGPTDFVAALWFVFRFNLFCSRRASFRKIPEIRRPNEQASDALES